MILTWYIFRQTLSSVLISTLVLVGIIWLSLYNASKKFLLNENDLPEKKPLQVEVIDFGKGIPESDFQNIFDPFITKKQDGKGLGLSIVSNSVRTLDAEEEPMREVDPQPERIQELSKEENISFEKLKIKV